MKLPAWVYLIRNEVTGRSYVGMTSNPKKREQQHFSALRAGRHPVEDMQADFNRYGGRFTFTILERVDAYQYRSAEFKWQIRHHTLDRRTGYNYKDPVTKWYKPTKPRYST